MDAYSRVVRGRAPLLSNAFVYSIVAALLIASFVIGRNYLVMLLATPAGIAAALAIVVALVIRTLMAPLPWIFVGAALLLEAAARILTPGGSFGSIFRLASYGALVAMVVITPFALTLKARRREGRLESSPARWGAVIVAAALFVGTAGLRAATPAYTDAFGRTDPRSEGGGIQASSEYGTPVVIGRIEDPAIDESSGLVASRSQLGVFWTHNDSGNDSFLYCLKANGRSCGTWEVTGAEVHDWEDIAAGPGIEPDVDYLYIGDIGDNDGSRESITVYQVPEPPSPSVAQAASRATDPVTTIELRYPDGARDAEAVMVHPYTGDLYIATKSATPTIYQTSPPFDTTGVTTLDKVSAAGLARLPEITGGDISPSGRRVVFSTYSTAFELLLPSRRSVSEFDSIWQQRFNKIEVGPAKQREAIAYGDDGRVLFVSSEGRRSPLYMIRRR